eukprot:gene20783-49928_t
MRFVQQVWYRTKQVTAGQYDIVYDPESMFGLPEELAAELRFFSNCNILRSVPELRHEVEHGDQAFIVHMVARMEYHVVPKNAELCNRGDAASGSPEQCTVRVLEFSELFFIPGDPDDPENDAFGDILDRFVTAERLFARAARDRKVRILAARAARDRKVRILAAPPAPPGTG